MGTNTVAGGWIDTDKISAVSAKSFGAEGNNSADDSGAIQAAINAAASSVGGASGNMVFLPQGTYILKSQVKVKNKVRLVGASRSGTILKAATGVGSSTGLVRLGDGTGNVFGCRVENLTVDCSDVASSVGVYSSEAQEQSGIIGCVVTSFQSYGVNFVSGIGALTEISMSEIYGSSAGATAGVHLAGSGSLTLMNHCTVSGVTTPMTNAIHNDGQTLSARGIHCETVTTGITFDTGALGSVTDMTGHSSVTTCVAIAGTNGGGIVLIGISPNGATNALVDSLTSRTITNQLEFYVVGTTGGAASSKEVFHSIATSPWRQAAAYVGSASFTATAAGATTVSNTLVNSGSNIIFFPTNAAAALLQRTKTCYVSNLASGSFIFNVSATGAGAPAGTETFGYTY